MKGLCCKGGWRSLRSVPEFGKAVLQGWHCVRLHKDHACWKSPTGPQGALHCRSMESLSLEKVSEVKSSHLTPADTTPGKFRSPDTGQSSRVRKGCSCAPVEFKSCPRDSCQDPCLTCRMQQSSVLTPFHLLTRCLCPHTGVTTSVNVCRVLFLEITPVTAEQGYPLNTCLHPLLPK